MKNTKSERAYTLKCEGMTNSEIGSIVGVDRKSVPTLAKNHMNRFSLPHWDTVKEGEVKDSGKKIGVDKFDAMCSIHADIKESLHNIMLKVDGMRNLDVITWGHVGSAGHVLELLKEIEEHLG